MANTYENAVKEVQSTTGQVIETETIVSEAPLLGQGMYPAQCVEVLVMDSPYSDAKPGAKVFKLKWKLEEEYKDNDGNTRPYVLLSKPYSICYGKQAALTELCLKLTGKPPVREEHSEQLEDGRHSIRRKFMPGQFVGMKSDVVIEHRDHQGRTYANIGNYLTGITRREHNCSLLPNLVNKHGR